MFDFRNTIDGTKRVCGIRNFELRLAYWMYPDASTSEKYPDRRLVYNYENDSWAIFNDSFTCFGTFQPQSAAVWSDFPAGDPSSSWGNQNYSWGAKPALIPDVVAGNQQGFIEILDQTVSNDVTLSITAITGNTTTPTQITSPDHNLQTGDVIEIVNIPAGTPFATSLNNKVFGITKNGANTFLIRSYSSSTRTFYTPQLDAPATYIGGGKIMVRDNFSIVSKKFNFLDDGQNIQLGFIDVLMPTTAAGYISLNVFIDYNDSLPVNTLPENINQNGDPVAFFNSTVPTFQEGGINSSKAWHRVFCNARGNFITLQWTLSNEQMNNDSQQSDVQIDSQIIWRRPAGKQLPQQ